MLKKKPQLLLLNQVSKGKIIISHMNFPVFAKYILFADTILFE